MMANTRERASMPKRLKEAASTDEDDTKTIKTLKT
jgi:hypothetical protein